MSEFGTKKPTPQWRLIKGLKWKDRFSQAAMKNRSFVVHVSSGVFNLISFTMTRWLSNIEQHEQRMTKKLALHLTLIIRCTSIEDYIKTSSNYNYYFFILHEILFLSRSRCGAPNFRYVYCHVLFLLKQLSRFQFKWLTMWDVRAKFGPHSELHSVAICTGIWFPHKPSIFTITSHEYSRIFIQITFISKTLKVLTCSAHQDPIYHRSELNFQPMKFPSNFYFYPLFCCRCSKHFIIKFTCSMPHPACHLRNIQNR